MIRALAIALVACAAGCGASDPCDGKPGVCLTVHVTGSAPALDEVAVEVATPSRTLDADSGPVSPPIVLPVQFALRLPLDTLDGTLGVEVFGRRANQTVAEGVAPAQLHGGRGSVVVMMSPLGSGDLGVPDLAGADLAGADFAGADLAGPDLAGVDLAGGIVLSPPSIVFPTMPAGSAPVTGTFTLSNSGSPATLGVPSLVGAPAFMFDATSTCKTLLPTGGSCTLVIRYAAPSPGIYNAAVSIAANGVQYSGALGARASGWLDESKPAANDINSIFGSSETDVWAGGNGGQLWHRTQAGWTQITNSPWSAAYNITGVWLGSVLALYVVGSSGPGAGTFYFSNNSGASWQTLTGIAPDPPVTVGGLDPVDVGIGCDHGEIDYGWPGTGFKLEYNGGSSVVPKWQIFGGGTTVFAVVGAQTLARSWTGSWTQRDPFANAALTDGWAVGGAEYYVGGTQLACANGSACGEVIHVLNGTQQATQFIGCPNVTGVGGASATFVVAVCSSPGLVFSSTGANAWTPETTNVTADLRAVWVAPDGEVFAAGAAGTLLHRY